MTIKTCLNCGAEIKEGQATKKYCCYECKNAYHNIKRRTTNRNVRCCPVGTERYRHSKNGAYYEVKTDQPNEWTPKSIYYYEKYNGVRVERKKQVVRFLDGDNKNYAKENLVLLTRGENLQLTKYLLKARTPFAPEEMLTLILYVRLRIARVKAAKKFPELVYHCPSHNAYMIKADADKWSARSKRKKETVTLYNLSGAEKK